MGMKNKKLIWSLITILVLVVLGGVFWGFRGRQPLRVGEIRVGEKVFKVEVAEDMVSRAKGLSGRTGLGENEGMLFIFSGPGNYGFWMKGMKFAIDIVWIRGDKIVGFSENLQPEIDKSIFNLTTYYPPEAVDWVLELGTGTVEREGLKVGDTIGFGSQ